jgi:hypothetical protein
LTLPVDFGHPGRRGTRQDVRHAEEDPTKIYS